MGHAMRVVIGEGFSESHGLWIILSEALNKWWNMEGILRLKMKSEQTLRNRIAACPVPQSLSITPTLWYITKEDARHTWRWRPSDAHSRMKFRIIWWQYWNACQPFCQENHVGILCHYYNPASKFLSTVVHLHISRNISAALCQSVFLSAWMSAYRRLDT